MPLQITPALEAMATRKENDFTAWGERGGENRVEPIASPWFDVPFKIRPGEKIFTIGSCFARNVEAELLRLGFQIPVRDLFQRPEFGGLSIGVLNNFGTPSIYNEISWAFGEQAFDIEANIMEVRPGKFADIHLLPTLRPVSLELAMSRRRAIAEAYRTAANCNLVIMTLGLVELWFDTKTGLYVNASPRLSMIEKEPDRFQHHVLTYDDAYSYLERALLILQQNVPQLRVLLTVSPVPMVNTHRRMDVMVANTYSKSLLRSVAEAIVAKYEFTTYFPSYESVVLSDRKRAWIDDLIHPTADIVATNVRRMIEAFVEGATDEETFDTGDPVAAVEAAKRARQNGLAAGGRFFDRYGTLSETNFEFAREHCRYLAAEGKPEAALSVLRPFDPQWGQVAVLTAEVLLGAERPHEAFEVLDKHCRSDTQSRVHWDLLLTAAIRTEQFDAVEAVLYRLGEALRGKVADFNLKAAKAFLAAGRRERAIQLAATALESEEAEMPRVALLLAEFFVAVGDVPRARNAMEDVRFPTAAQNERLERLKAILSSQEEIEAEVQQPLPYYSSTAAAI